MKLTRYDGHVPLFSQNMEGRERTLFGSTVQDDDINNQFTPEFLRGWGSVGSTEFPTLQDFNALAYTHNKLLSYLYQAGIPSYTQNEEYYIGSIVQYNKDIYICLRDKPTVLPTDTNAWKRLINVSDMSQEVINNDLLTVTSGAVYRALQPKADSTYVNAELNKKANLTYVNSELLKKADKTYVDSELLNKADLTYVDTELDKKITGGNVVQTTGQSTVDVMSQKASSDEFNNTFGRSQKWVNVTSERIRGVTYVNNTDNTIFIWIQKAPSETVVEIKIGNESFGLSTLAGSVTFTLPVAPNQEYSQVSGTVVNWKEFR